VEDVKTTFYDTLRMAGKVRIDPKNSVLKCRRNLEVIYGYSKDVWMQVPGKIMFGNGVSWMCLIFLDLSYNKEKEYILKEMSVQQGLLK